jgi:hypothetical protein
MVPHVPIGVVAPVAMMPVNARPRSLLHRIGGVSRRDAEQSLNAADDAADRAADYGADWSRRLPPDVSAMRRAAGNPLRLSRQWAGQRGKNRACKYNVKLHATTPLVVV